MALQIYMGGKIIEYKIRHSIRAKNMIIRISPDTGLEIVLPRGFKPVNLEACLKSRESWIMARLNYCDRGSLESSRQAMYMGQKYDIVPVVRHGAATEIKRLDGKIFATVPDDSPETLTTALEKWYRAQAGIIFEERVRAVNIKTGFRINRISIRGQKTRWGSCSRLGNLNFNWKLIMAPQAVIDYIVIHELAHLKEMNHSSRFWSLVESLCPDYKKHRKWLKENGLRLTLPTLA